MNILTCVNAVVLVGRTVSKLNLIRVTIYARLENPMKFEKSPSTEIVPKSDCEEEEETCIFIVEGSLLYTYRP